MNLRLRESNVRRSVRREGNEKRRPPENYKSFHTVNRGIYRILSFTFLSFMAMLSICTSGYATADECVIDVEEPLDVEFMISDDPMGDTLSADESLFVVVTSKMAKPIMVNLALRVICPAVGFDKELYDTEWYLEPQTATAVPVKLDKADFEVRGNDQACQLIPIVYVPRGDGSSFMQSGTGAFASVEKDSFVVVTQEQYEKRIEETGGVYYRLLETAPSYEPVEPPALPKPGEELPQ